MNRDEFAELAVSYLDELTAFALRLTSNAADADDLVQMAFERAFRAWSTLREPGACRTWLFRIARNAFLNERRARNARPELQLVEFDPLRDLPVVPAEAVERLDARALEEALSTLAAEQRETLLLSDLWGFTYDEIAEITGVPTGTVRSRIARARGRIIAHLGEASEGRRRRRRSP
ncbi:MAG: sigma-70 family RNA polymerase sigma factor [Acidobacteria bacterium]|nr:sigma-70 family RNA polymerase sigma factor [Acidobacteriota bacterium]